MTTEEDSTEEKSAIEKVKGKISNFIEKREEKKEIAKQERLARYASGNQTIKDRLKNKLSQITPTRKDFIGGRYTTNEDEAIWYLTFALLLFASDLFVTRFNGLAWSKVSFFITNNIIDLFWHIVNGLTLFIFVMWFLTSRKNLRDIVAFIFLESIFYFIGIHSGFRLGSLLHLAFALIIYFKLIRPYSEEPWQGYMWLSFILSVDFFLIANIPYLKTIQMFPVWFFAIRFIFSDHLNKTWKSNTLTTIIILFYSFALLSAATDFSDMSQILDPSVNAGLSKMAKDSYNNFIETYDNLIYSAKRTFNQSMKVYREEFYTGEIDSNAKLDLGVYIEDIEQASTEYYIDEPINIWSTLVIKTIGEEKPIEVKTYCVADISDNDKRRDADKVSPESFKASSYDEIPVDCIFNPFSLDKGSHIITLSADFEFMTSAYQKVYFMDKEMALSLERQKIDPLDHFSITDKDPSSIYTNGPVMIGMKFRNNPIKVTDEENQHLVLGITISNSWDGEITNLTSLTITSPREIDISENCGGYNLTCKKEEEYNVCHLNSTKIGKITEFKTIRCPITIAEGNINALLGEAPLSIRYFRVYTDYWYHLKKRTTLNLIESKEIKELKEKTKLTPPTFAVPNLYIKKDDTKEIDLKIFTEDKETTNKKYFSYELEEGPCSLKGSIISCKGTEDSTIKLKVSDLAQKTSTSFKIIVGEKECNWGFNSCTEEANNEEGITAINSGPIFNFPEEKIILENSYKLNFDKYVKDSQTPNQDLHFIMNNGANPYLNINKDSGNTYIFTPKTNQCITDYNYLFSIYGNQKITNEYIIKFDIIPSICSNDCTKCTTNCCSLRKSCEISADSCIPKQGTTNEEELIISGP